MKNTVPKKIWIFWQQGFDEAPLIVKKCAASWIAKNPSWETNLLDQKNLAQFIDLTDDGIKDIGLSQKSDIIRLALLKSHGGIWVDATTYCINPLDNWISNHTMSGFFAFSKPGHDRSISSWFLASTRESPLITKFYSETHDYFQRNNFKKPIYVQRLIYDLLLRAISRNEWTTQFWFTPIITKVLRVYPYSAIHYIFNYLIRKDKNVIEIWNKTPKISAQGPLAAQFIGLFSAPTRNSLQKIYAQV